MSLLSPLKAPHFRDFWIGMSLSTTGYWMQMIVVIWIMKSWSDGDVILISFVQTAFFLPVMLFSLPAGVISDRIDRRQLLIWAHLLMALAPLLIALITSLEIHSPLGLLALTALFASGNALKLPSQSAMVPDLVERNQLVAALGLNSISTNGGRIIGPGIAGALTPLMGPVYVLIINAASYLAFVVVLLKMKSLPNRNKIKQSFASDIQDLLAFLKEQAQYSATLVRGSLYFLSWPLVMIALPLLAKDASTFGLVYSFFGVGAICGAFVIHKLRRYFNTTSTLTISVVMHAIATALIPYSESPSQMCVSVFVLGLASFLGMNALQISAQAVLPSELRGRGLSLMNMLFMGATALASPFWGSVTDAIGLQACSLIASLFSLIVLVSTARMKLADVG